MLGALRSGHWGRLDGNEVSEFEERFAAMHGCQHGIAMVNGTVSLRLGLMAAGLEAESEVIIPPYTFFSTASAVIEANMVPVFADVDLDTFNLDPQAVEAAITPRTRAVIPVHFAGQVADMDAIMAIAEKHKLLVIEDAAHAHGASYKNRPAGSLADLASFSFQSSKNLTCGEGGLLTTNDREAGRLLPLAPQLRPHSNRRVVRAPCDFRQLPPRRIAGGLAQRAARPARRSNQDPRRQWPVSAAAARESAGPASATAPRLLHAARVPSVHVAYRWPSISAHRAPR